MRLGSKLFTAGILLLTACGGGSGVVTTTAPEASSQSTTTSEAPTTTTVAPEPEAATLADYLPMMGQEDPEEDQEYWRRQELAAQELTRDRGIHFHHQLHWLIREYRAEHGLDGVHDCMGVEGLRDGLHSPGLDL